jgi:hypothetical protein
MSAVSNRQQPTVSHMGHSHGGHGHRWMMIVCCIPMLAIAIALVATGVVSAAFLLYAVGCTLMMALMMVGMGHGKDEHQGVYNGTYIIRTILRHDG